MTKVVIERYEAFGTAGKASKLKPLQLEDMFKRYEKGDAGSGRQLIRSTS